MGSRFRDRSSPSPAAAASASRGISNASSLLHHETALWTEHTLWNSLQLTFTFTSTSHHIHLHIRIRIHTLIPRMLNALQLVDHHSFSFSHIHIFSYSSIRSSSEQITIAHNQLLSWLFFSAVYCSFGFLHSLHAPRNEPSNCTIFTREKFSTLYSLKFWFFLATKRHYAKNVYKLCVWFIE